MASNQTGNFTAPQSVVSTNWKFNDWRIDLDTRTLYASISYIDSGGNVKILPMAPVTMPIAVTQNLATAITNQAISQGVLPAGSTVVIS